MMTRVHSLHGRVKRFWVFLAVTSIVAFIANAASQMILQGGIDIKRAVTISLTLGIVLAIIMSSQHRSGGSGKA